MHLLSRLPLVLLVAFLLPTQALAQQTVRDSVKVTWHIHTFNLPKSEGDTCGYLLYVTWPNVAERVLNREFRYWEYRLAATGEDGWITRGMELRAWQWGIDLGEDTYAYDPQLFGFGPDRNCGERIAGGQATFGGRPRRVNGRTWRVTPWYAMYSVPDGTPIAAFEWEQTNELAVAFDGSFESDLSREATVDGRKPVASYEWDFGDGTVSTEPVPTHTYDTPGTYVVSLTVTDDDGETDTVTEEVVVTGVILSYEVTVPENVFIDDTLHVIVEITNTGVGTATTASVLKDALMFPSYPPDLVAAHTNNARHSGPLLDSGDETVNDLAPGESFSFEQKYKITRSAHSLIDGVGWKDHTVDWKMKAQNISGEDENGNKPIVKDACDENACDNVTTVGDPEPEMRYALTLERVPGGGAKARAKDGGDTAALVGDTVLTKIRVENFGDVPLENVRLPQDEASIQIGTEANRTALAFAKSIRSTIARLEPEASGEIVFAHEVMHEVQGTLQIFVSAVEATAVNEETGARETISEIVTSCSVSNKAGIPESQGCANLQIAAPRLERRFTVRPDTVDLSTNLVVNVLVQNTGSVDITDVVPGAEPTVANVTYPDLPGGTTTPPEFELDAEPDPASVTLAPGETEGFQFRFRITRTAQWTTDDGTKQAIPATVVFKPGPGTQGQVENLLVGAESTCDPSPCTDTTVVRGAVFKIDIESRSEEPLRTGLLPASSAEGVRFVRYETAGGGQRPVCENGCVDLVLTVTDEADDPGKNMDVDVTVKQFGRLLDGADGGFACERVVLGEEGACADAGQPLTVRTDDNGEARVWYALAAGYPAGDRGQPHRLDIRAEVTAVADETTDGTLFLDIEQTIIREVDLSLSDGAKVYGAIAHAISATAGAVSIGEYCESYVGWVADLGKDAAKLTRYQKNLLQTGVGPLVPWVCDAAVALVGKTGPIGNFLKTINEVGDPTKKVADILQTTWMFTEFGIDNGSDLLALNGPVPPLGFWFRGDALGFTDAVTGRVTLGTGVSHDLLIQEGSGLARPSGPTTESDFAPSRFTGVLRMHYRGVNADEEAIISDGYSPLRTGLDARQVFSNGFLVGNPSLSARGVKSALAANKAAAPDPLLATLEQAVSAGAVSFDARDWAGQPGDYIVVGSGSATPEVAQVAGAGSGAAVTTLTLTTPLRYGHAAGALIERIAPGTLAPPAPPVLRPHLSEEAPEALAWVSMPTALSAAYDVQVASDTSGGVFELVIDETGLSTSSLQIDPGLFVIPGEHYWRVRAANTLGTGPWSAWQSFQAGPPLATCDNPVLAGEVVDRTARTVSNTIEDGDGIASFTFTTLDNFTVSIDDPDGLFTRTGDPAASGVSYAFSGSPGAEPIAVGFTLQAGPDGSATYFVKITDACPTGARTAHVDPVYEFGPAVTAMRLMGSYPNPTRGATTIAFALPEAGFATLAIYDVMGRQVATLVDGETAAGTHAVRWNGRSDQGAALASGLYLIRMRVEDASGRHVRTRRLTLVR